MKNAPLALGRVNSLCLNGEAVQAVTCDIFGPVDDTHRGLIRAVSGHDGAYCNTSALKKGDPIFNFRSWTAVSVEEIAQVERSIDYEIPVGCLLENLRITGVPNFSQLPPTSRLVFPKREEQLILAVWEENGPCHGVGMRLEQHHGVAGLSSRFIAAARHKRGVMGFVLSIGRVEVGDEVLVYPPVE